MAPLPWRTSPISTSSSSTLTAGRIPCGQSTDTTAAHSWTPCVGSASRRPAERMLNDSQVVRWVKDLGYRIVVYETAADFESLENADVYLAPTFDENRQEFALLSG